MQGIGGDGGGTHSWSYLEDCDLRTKDKPRPLQKTLDGISDKLRQLYNKEKMASLAATIAEADTDKMIATHVRNVWYPECFGTALDSIKVVFS